jgi:hypothetical protein
MKSGSTQSVDWRAYDNGPSTQKRGIAVAITEINDVQRERSNVRKALEGLDHTPTYHVSVKSPDRPR